MSGTALLVTGMPASGTSALMGSLRLLGVHLGTEEKLEGTLALNPLGNWEHQEVRAINNDILKACGAEPLSADHVDVGCIGDWEYDELVGRIQELVEREFDGVGLWGVKDPRLCKLIPIWEEALVSMDIHMRVVISLRGPEEVSQSIASRRKITLDEGYRTWESMYGQILQDTVQNDRVFVLYDHLMSGGLLLREELFDVDPSFFRSTERQWKSVEEFLRVELYHGRPSGGTVVLLEQLAEAWTR